MLCFTVFALILLLTVGTDALGTHFANSRKVIRQTKIHRALVAHTFNSRTLGDRGRRISVNLKLAWSIEMGLRQPRLHTVKPYLKDNNNNNNNKKRDKV